MSATINIVFSWDAGQFTQQLSTLLATILSNQTKELNAMNELDTLITTLTQDVAAETTVEASAVTLINGIPALIAASGRARPRPPAPRLPSWHL